jgi:hypothetical protein
MKLPSPREKLAGCVWLARIVAKARCAVAHQLPPEYEARFCHPTGTDGQFIAFFGVTREDILGVSGKSDDQIGAWFIGRPGSSPARIEEWNHLAVNFGRPGFPMEGRVPIALSTTYKHLAGRKIETIFELLEADEAVGQTA